MSRVGVRGLIRCKSMAVKYRGRKTPRGYPKTGFEQEEHEDMDDTWATDFPQVAGNLSPRMVVVPETSSASLVVELNIDHPGDGALAISVVHLAKHPSDHSPLKVSFASRKDNKPRLFHFLNVWTTRPDLMEVIRQAWNMEVQGSPLRILCSKLLAARRGIQGWNKQSFGNIFDAVKEAEVGLLRAEGAMVHGDSEGAQVELNKAQTELRRALAVEEQYCRQKARVTWLHNGDRTSKYFHEVVKQWRVQGMIHRVKRADEVWVEDDNGIATDSIEYFSNLFSSDTSSNLDGLLGLIPSLVSREDTMILEEVPTLEEVRRVVFATDGESAAGLDSFTGKFFTFAWDIIAQNVHKAIVSFFCGAELPRFITSTSIVLIPNDLNP
ncbi:uncharacterized protein [Coffea arabica]|uniref:Uncharacterized protein n=1 Tax=Coffea arabica TaxID=13443 RepID=A0A6P6X3Q0_COFAR|nr:uncharacterized protein LOC113739092 [Coffea arabica]